MKRLLALLAGAFGLRALLRRRPRSAFPQGASPADELRSRLADARTAPAPAAAEPETLARTEPVDEPSGDEPSPSGDEPSVDERRADVHNRARGAIDELKS